MAVRTDHYLQHRDYQAVALSHFLIDILNSSRSLVVAILAVIIGLSNVQVAVVLLLYNVGNALSQPLFGRLADRIGPRWLVIGGDSWMCFFFSLAAIAPPWPALASLTIAGLGSGAFHPTGTMVASQASEKHRTQATSIFFMAGQLGLFVGPIVAGLLLERFGRIGFIVLPIVAFTGVLSAWLWLPNTPHKDSGSAATTNNSAQESIWKYLLTSNALLLAVVIFCVSTISLSTITFAPKLYTELGYNQAYIGLITGIFMLGSAVGGVVGGMLADRWNGRIVILIAAAASIIPASMYVASGDVARLILLLIAGFFIGMPHSVLVIMVQGLIPGQRAMASGLALGFNFFSGSLGILAVGYIADQIGLVMALQITALLAIGAILATLLMPLASKRVSYQSTTH